MTLSVKATNNYQIRTNPNKSSKYDKYLPLKTAALSTAFWTAIGLGGDYIIMNKILKMKSSKKQSLIINGLFGLVMGIFTFFKTKKMQKNENIKNINDFIENFVNEN